MRLRHALSGGFVHRLPDGSYAAGPGGPGDTAKSPADTKPDDVEKAKTDAAKTDDEKAEKDKGDQGDGERMSDEAEKAIDTLIESTSGEDQLAAVHQVAETGEVSADLVATVAQGMGIEPEALQGQIGGVLEAFESQARQVISEAAGGIDSERVLEWVREHRADELNKAMIEQGTKRSTAGYANLAREYVNGLDNHDPEAILTATFSDGITARRDEQGKVILNINGQDIPWASAVRSGAITVKGG